MEVTVRRVRPGDGPVVAGLRLAALADSPDAFASSYEAEVGRSPAEWEQRAVEAASGQDKATFLAVCAGEPVGLVTAYRDEGSSFEVISMWVAPAGRRRGAGSALVGAVLRWAAAAGADRVVLWVRKANPGAVAFYGGAGFTVVDECDTEWRMARPPSSDATRGQDRFLKATGGQGVAQFGQRADRR